MPTVPIPAEVVGDFDTITRRHDTADGPVVSWAATLVDVPNHGGSESLCMEMLTQAVIVRDNVAREFRRRAFVASDLAHAHERNPRYSSWTKPVSR